MRNLALVLFLCLAGCEGVVTGQRAGQPAERPKDPTLTPGDARELPSDSSRAARLSNGEYENTTRDFLGEESTLGLTANFAADLTNSTFNNNGGDLTVTSAQWQDFQTAAEELARRATASTEALSRAAGGVLPTDQTSLISALGRRAFRRALTADERSAFATLYTLGATSYPTMTRQLAGARVVLEGMLQSPHFLYRVELSEQSAGDVTPLGADELANRLSYALWQSMPDAELFASVESGQLLTVEGYTAQASRMMADLKAHDAMQAFHAQLLGQQKYSDITRSTTLFPEFNVGLRASMKNEQVAFIDEIIFGQQQNLKTLFTAPFSVVDANLAKVYGLQGDFSGGLTKVSFTDGTRAGLFTQIGFLAAQATSTDSDPIHRGVFLNHQVLCAPLPSPPNNVPPLPPEDGMPKTLRTRITNFTGTGTCGAGCHSTMINPIGFAYEHYDALGRWRDIDRTLPIDAKDTYNFQGTPRSYDGAVELATAMAEEPMAHACYAQHWVEFLYGRSVSTADAALIARAGRRSHDEGLPVTSLLRLMVESESFKTRPTGVSP